MNPKSSVKSFCCLVGSLIINSFSISFWFNTKDARSIKRIVEHRWYTSPVDSGMFTTHINNGKVYAGLTMADGNQPFIVASDTISANKWYQYASVYNGTVASVYLNRVLKGSNVINKQIKKTTKSLIIGEAPGLTFNGRIDEVIIYNRALTTDEAKKIYDEQKNKLL